jgi:hypothetical protein
MGNSTIRWFEETFSRMSDVAQRVIVGFDNGMYDNLPYSKLKKIRDDFEMICLDELDVADIAYKLATTENSVHPNSEKARQCVKSLIAKLSQRLDSMGDN